MKVNIFNLQRFSLHDGPGIRTVVFFKGCPLKCPWCANPESQNKSIEISWNKNKCKLCMNCIKNYPNIFYYENSKIKINSKNIVENIDFIELCPNSALAYEGKKIAIEEIIDTVLKDKVFYEESGGGVTLSGGEVLFQINEAICLLKKLKENNIHTAIETTCFCSSEMFEKILPFVDLLIFDIKHYDSNYHKKITGVSLEVIKKNIQLAISHKKNILARVPIIPNFNNAIEDMEKFLKYFNELGIKEVQLLPFHQFGENKYSLLNKEYLYSSIEALRKEDLLPYIDFFNLNNINCF